MSLLDERADETVRAGALELPASSAQPGRPGVGWSMHRDHMATRAGWSAVCVMVVTLGVQAWSASFMLPVASVGQMVVVAFGIAALIGCWTSSAGPSTRLQLAILTAVAVTVVIAAAQQVLVAPYYGTDSIAFGQYAADRVLHGQNPYALSMAPALADYHVPVIFNTHFLDGRPMVAMSYPAGSFLPYLPFLALGWHTQTAVVINVAFWIGSLFLLWRLLPSRLRFVAGLILGLTSYSSYVIGGVTDPLYLPFLLLAVWRWDRFADGAERTAARWIGPVALGVAMSIKQTPWFLFPFLVAGVSMQSYDRDGNWLRTGSRYLTTAIVVFVALNLPWIVAGPVIWWRGSVAPLVAQFVPMGQGLVNLTLVHQVGGGRLTYYSIAAAGWVMLSLLLFLLRYREAKRIWLPFLVGAFFLTPRSLGNYLIMLLPAALLAAVTVESAPQRTITDRFPRLRGVTKPLLWLNLAGVFGAVAVALLARPPLTIHIDGVRTNGQQNAVTDVTVTITNNTGSAQQPHFTVNRDGYVTNFWYPHGSASGGTSLTLPPRAGRTVTLQAPDLPSMPAVDEPFQVYAYTAKPASISSSDLSTTSELFVVLNPAAVDRPVPVGVPVTFTAQLEDRLGRDVDRAGVRIALGQVVYAQNGLLGGDSSINGKPEGASSAYVDTDRHGRAPFTVVGRQPQNMPVYYQAWIAPSGAAPSGYSSIVIVQFTGR